MAVKTETVVGIIASLVGIVVAVFTIPTLFKKEAPPGPGGLPGSEPDTYGGGASYSGGASNPPAGFLSGFFDWIGSIVAPPAATPPAGGGAGSPTNPSPNAPPIAAPPVTVPQPGGGGSSAVMPPIHTPAPAPPVATAPVHTPAPAPPRSSFTTTPAAPPAGGGGGRTGGVAVRVF